jgi:hypothetical protein
MRITPNPVKNPKHWRGRAVEMRALAIVMKDIETQAIMAGLADEYDKLADRAQARIDGSTPQPK